MSTTLVNFKLDIQKVHNMGSPRTGTPVANQYVIDTPNMQIFQSYSSIIAVRRYNHGEGASIILDPKYWDYSITTLKYLKEFLGTYDSKKEIQAKIDSGEYATAELN